MESEREKRIRERAYELWEQAGRPPGRHDEHWRQAEAELAEAEAAKGAAAAGNKPAGGSPETTGADPAPSAPTRRSRAASKPAAQRAPASGKRERKPAE